MLISFFEEFPAKNNLNKLKLVKFPTKLYLASKTLNEFLELKNKIGKGYNTPIKEFIYWPILKIEEGYWISPFSQRKALERIFKELENKKISVMLDLELPTTKNPKLYLTQFLNFLKNKFLIKKFIKNYRGKVYLAEYYPEGRIKEKCMQFLGLHYNHKKAKIIKMVYHSMHRFNKEFIANELKTGKKEFGGNFLVAYGTIAQGVGGWEPKLSLSQFKEDLKIAKEIGIKEVVIYRLGGLAKDYLKIIKNIL